MATAASKTTKTASKTTKKAVAAKATKKPTKKTAAKKTAAKEKPTPKVTTKTAKAAATHTTEPTAFLKEVDEHLHYEQMKELWDKYKAALFATIIILFVAVGGITYYAQNKETTLAEHATSWWQASQAQTPEEGMKALEEIATNADAGHRILSRIQLAKIAISKGDTETALTELRAIKNDSGAGVLYQDMAAFFEAQALMATDPAQAKTLLTTLDNTNSPFKFSALEILAIMAENAGNKAEAVALYERIAEAEGITPLMRSRAKNRINMLNFK